MRRAVRTVTAWVALGISASCGGPARDPGPPVPALVSNRGAGVVEYTVRPGEPTLVRVRCQPNLVTTRLMNSDAVLPGETSFQQVTHPWKREGLEVTLREATVHEHSYDAWVVTGGIRLTVQERDAEATGKLSRRELLRALKRDGSRYGDWNPESFRRERQNDRTVEAEIELWLPEGFDPRQRIQRIRFESLAPLVETFGMRLTWSSDGALSVRAPDGLDCDRWDDPGRGV